MTEDCTAYIRFGAIPQKGLDTHVCMHGMCVFKQNDKGITFNIDRARVCGFHQGGCMVDTVYAEVQIQWHRHIAIYKEKIMKVQGTVANVQTI